MTSQVLVSVKLDYYHQAFLRGYFEQYDPVFAFPQGNDLARRLEVLLRQTPPNPKQCSGDKLFKIVVPPMKHKNPLQYCYLSEVASNMFVNKIVDFAKLVFHEKMTELRNAGFEYQECVYLFMDEFNLPEDCFDRLIKDLQRWRNRVRFKKHYKSSFVTDGKNDSSKKMQKNSKKNTKKQPQNSAFCPA